MWKVSESGDDSIFVPRCKTIVLRSYMHVAYNNHLQATAYYTYIMRKRRSITCEDNFQV